MTNKPNNLASLFFFYRQNLINLLTQFPEYGEKIGLTLDEINTDPSDEEFVSRTEVMKDHIDSIKQLYRLK